MTVKGTGIPIPDYDPSVVRRIPDWEERIECYGIGCGERSAFVIVTPHGKGGFCETHGQEVLLAVPKLASSSVVEYPGWLPEAFLLACLSA